MPCKPYPMQRRLVRRATRLLGALRLRRLHCASKTILPATVRSDRCSPNDKTRLIDLVCRPPFLRGPDLYTAQCCNKVSDKQMQYFRVHIFVRRRLKRSGAGNISAAKRTLNIRSAFFFICGLRYCLRSRICGQP